ncbi:hypothetical protein PTKU64_88450 [Paraburkholderia terrae]|uniref:DUF1488 domain-containing protein n=1 Tax=Paraburkholderia terrae TaxID=311230 RepID=A0ABM7U2G5_9BURK|nr:hypothetical protein PTKU64_88450 [Paraburkholderia terrae]
MPEETRHSWKGLDVRICTIPVRHIVSSASAPDGYVAIVRVETEGTVLADWHLPRFSERWSSMGEARRAAFEYVVKLVDRGVFGAPAAPALATAEGSHRNGCPRNGENHGYRSAKVEPVQIPAPGQNGRA